MFRRSNSRGGVKFSLVNLGGFRVKFSLVIDIGK